FNKVFGLLDRVFIGSEIVVCTSQFINRLYAFPIFMKFTILSLLAHCRAHENKIYRKFSINEADGIPFYHALILAHINTKRFIIMSLHQKYISSIMFTFLRIRCFDFFIKYYMKIILDTRLVFPNSNEQNKDEWD